MYTGYGKLNYGGLARVQNRRRRRRRRRLGVNAAEDIAF